MAHNKDARADELCAAARDGFNAVVTECWLGQNKEKAALVADLGKQIFSGLEGTEGRPAANQMEKPRELTQDVRRGGPG